MKIKMLIIQPKIKAIFYRVNTYFFWIILRVNSISELLQDISQPARLRIWVYSKRKIFSVNQKMQNTGKNQATTCRCNLSLHLFHFKITLKSQSKYHTDQALTCFYHQKYCLNFSFFSFLFWVVV